MHTRHGEREGVVASKDRRRLAIGPFSILCFSLCKISFAVVVVVHLRCQERRHRNMLTAAAGSIGKIGPNLSDNLVT